jgi:ComF family protein
VNPLKFIFNDFIDLVFPDNCSACDSVLFKGEEYICTRCRYNLPKTEYHISPEDENELTKKLWGRARIKYGLAYLKFTKKGSVQKLLHTIKYQNEKEIARTLGHWYGHDLQSSGLNNTFDLMLPIPLHKNKLKRRGFNQSEWFAKGLSESMNIPYSNDFIVRIAEKSTQTNKGRLERWENVDGIYKVQNGEVLKNKHILLVDDVATTGATFESCIEELNRYEVKDVSIAVIAVAR